MRDIWRESADKELNKKKITILIITIIVIILLIIASIIYVVNKETREWIDRNILRKEVKQASVATIELKDENSNIVAFNKYIGILNKNQFEIYNNSGNKEECLEIQISSPIFDSANRFLAIAELKGQKVYMISDKTVLWENNIEGEIAQIHVNKNGYVAVVIVNTSHKTVIEMYNSEGKELFKTYLASTRTIDATISNDNKYLAIAELDTSGSVIKSNIKVISIDKASSNPTNSLDTTYESENNRLITNIKYQNKNRLVCMYTDSIHIIENGQDNTILDSNNKKIIFQSVDLSDNVVYVEEQSSGLFSADSMVGIVNVDSRNVKNYIVNSIAKEMYLAENIIALNLGTEIEFINEGGWLVKRYIANQEITNIVVSNTIAGIIYRDKIEIVNL